MMCLEEGDGCSGTVSYRMPLSGSGASFPRCDAHWDARLRLQEQLERRYPAEQPSDFDPGYAGESWYGD